MYKRTVLALLTVAWMVFTTACSWTSVDYKNLLLYFAMANYVPANGVSLNKNWTTMLVSGTEQLTATVMPLNATFKRVTWSSSDPAVVTVSKKGLLTAVADGMATVTATSFDGGLIATCAVKTTSVPVAAVSVALNKTSTVILAGSAEQLAATIYPINCTDQNLVWTSSDESIATVGPGGLVRAVADGTVTITVTTNDGGFTASCAVTVSSVPVAVTGITLDKTSITVGAGSCVQLMATIIPSNATNQNITWTTSNPAITMVGPGGLVVVTAPGTATITARTVSGGYTANCDITAYVQASAQWARSLVSPADYTIFADISTSSDGSAYAAGVIQSTAAGAYDFGGATVPITWLGRNCVLVKYNSSGTAQWARSTVNGVEDTSFNGVAAAPDGSVYAIGDLDTANSYDFGNGVSFTTTNGSAVLVKYNSSGLAQWAHYVVSATRRSSFNGVAVAQDGSIFVAGKVVGIDTYDFGNGITVAGTTLDVSQAVLVKYDASGLAQWARIVTGGGFDTVYNVVSMAPDGSVYCAGTLFNNGTYDFGNGVTTNGGYAGGENAVVVKYDAPGLAQWARSVSSGSSASSFQGIATAPDGSVYASGSINGSAAFDFSYGITATGPSVSTNALLIKYDSTGVPQWARTALTGIGMSGFVRVSTASDGSIYTAGGIQGSSPFDFGNGVTITGSIALVMNPVLLKYDSAGVAQWAVTVSAGGDQSYFSGVAVAPDGAIYAGGLMTGTGTYDFENGVIVAGPHTAENCLLVQYK